MIVAHIIVSTIGAVLNGGAAVVYLIGHEYPKAQADMKGIPRRYVPVLGLLLAAGAAGLLAGLVFPPVGLAAALGLILYFAGAIVAHLRVGSRSIVAGVVFLLIALAALILGLFRVGLA